MYKVVIFVFSVLLVSGCKKDSTKSIESFFPGYYKAKKITSGIAVDLNNDGFRSIDLYSEITSPFTTINGQQISFYNFESVGNYIEVRPLHNQVNQGKLIAFNFPHQAIDYRSDNTPYLICYINEFLNYTYQFAGYNNIEVKSTNPGYTDQIGEINSVVLKENGDLSVTLKKQVFDFVSSTWQNIDIIAEYSKMP